MSDYEMYFPESENIYDFQPVDDPSGFPTVVAEMSYNGRPTLMKAMFDTELYIYRLSVKGPYDRDFVDFEVASRWDEANRAFMPEMLYRTENDML